MNPPLPAGRVPVRVEGLGRRTEPVEVVRSLYFPGPEGNLLEFVCYDESVR